MSRFLFVFYILCFSRHYWLHWFKLIVYHHHIIFDFFDSWKISTVSFKHNKKRSSNLIQKHVKCVAKAKWRKWNKFSSSSVLVRSWILLLVDDVNLQLFCVELSFCKNEKFHHPDINKNTPRLKQPVSSSKSFSTILTCNIKILY
jgi:hypothetical protein